MRQAKNTKCPNYILLFLFISIVWVVNILTSFLSSMYWIKVILPCTFYSEHTLYLFNIFIQVFNIFTNLIELPCDIHRYIDTLILIILHVVETAVVEPFFMVVFAATFTHVLPNLALEVVFV